MRTIKESWIVILIFIVFFLFGVVITNFYYYPSRFFYVYWLFCVVLVGSAVVSKVYLYPVKAKQLIPIVLISLTYLFGWFLVPQASRFGAFLFSTFCFLFVGTIILNSRYTFLKALYILGFLISTFNIVPILFFITQRSKITRELISTLFISNSQEAKEYVSANISIAHIAVILGFVLISFFLFFFRKRENDRKIGFGIFFLLVISFASLILSGPAGALTSEYGSYLYQKRKLKQMVDERGKGLATKDLKIEANPNQATKVIIIIGESLNRSYMSLYGYNRNSSPNLLNMSKDTLSKGKLYVFNNVISPEVNTVPTLEKVLTNINNQHPIEFVKSVSLLDLYKKAGYETFWLSNQAPLGEHDTPIAVIASSATKQYFTTRSNIADNEGAPKGTYYDGALLQPFKQFISEGKGAKKQVYFIHLMGSHVNYEDRYPERFNVFKEKEINNVNLYLNSIRYNDWLVSNIIKIGKENQADVICYFSDHGDEMGWGHSSETYKTGMSLIPFMVYLSDDYMKKNPAIAKQLMKNKNTPGMTDNFFNDIQGITGLKSSLYNQNESFISDQYKVLKRRVINNSIPFDK
jgi:heptose-I-phosphate ethanolaminephosphotransferase